MADRDWLRAHVLDPMRLFHEEATLRSTVVEIVCFFDTRDRDEVLGLAEALRNQLVRRGVKDVKILDKSRYSATPAHLRAACVRYARCLDVLVFMTAPPRRSKRIGESDRPPPVASSSNTEAALAASVRALVEDVAHALRSSPECDAVRDAASRMVRVHKEYDNAELSEKADAADKLRDAIASAIRVVSA